MGQQLVAHARAFCCEGRLRPRHHKLGLRGFYTKFPKVELHVHLDGAWDDSYLYQIARKHVDRLPATVARGDSSVPLQEAVRSAASEEDFLKKYIYLPQSCATLSEFLAPFSLFNAIVMTALQADGTGVIEEFAFRFVKRQRECNVIYTEVRYCPVLLVSEEEAVDESKRYDRTKEIVLAVASGLKRGEESYGVKVRQILCCVDFAPHFSKDIARVLKDVGKDMGLLAIDIAGGESHFAQAGNPCWQAVMDVREEGFAVCMHAGEDPNTGGLAVNVKKAVEDYGATRIGHGYAILSDDSVLEFVKKQKDPQLHFEMCPTSSFLTGGFGPKTRPWTEHPLRTCCNLGLSCSVNTDDPLVCHMCISDEWQRCVEEIGMSQADMRAITENSIEAAFCSAEEKKDLRAQVAEFYK